MGSKLKTKTCENCTRSFTTYEEGQTACSKKCAGELKTRRSLVECVCKTCSEKFFVKKADVAEGRGLYCSLSCSACRPKKFDEEVALHLWSEGLSARQVALRLDSSPMTIRRWLVQLGIFEQRKARGENHYAWVDGEGTYRRIAFEHWGARCAVCGYDKYDAVLQVHHIDRDRSNNRPSNLRVLCPTHHEEAHYEEHSGRYGHPPRTPTAR